MSIRTVMLAALAFAASSASAQVSELYLNTHGDGAGGVYVVRGGVIQRSWNAGDASGSLFVNGTVRTAGNTGGAAGAGEEFTAAGVPTGMTFPTPGTGGHTDDSTTDGAFAYGFDYAAQRLVRMNLDWSSPVTMVSIFPGHAGVTYDPTDGTFWLAGWELAQIDHVSASGTLLGTFPTTRNNDVGLALDHADNTLWLSVWGTNTIEQYSKTGLLLQTVSVPGLPGNIAGAEFDFVPAPGALTLAAILGLGAVRRKR
jgi:hypothetical protein